MAQAMTLKLHHRLPPVSVAQNNGTTTRRHATFHLDGVQSSNLRPGIAATELLLGYGNVVTVEYPREGDFDNRRIVSQLVSAASQYEEATLLGLSLGGLLAHDVLAAAKRAGVRTRFRLVLADTPSGADTLYMGRQARLAARLAPFFYEEGPRLMQLLLFHQLERDGCRLRAVPKPAQNVGDLTLVEQEELDEHVRQCANCAIGPWFNQLRYIVQHEGPQPDVLHETPAVYLQSKRDEIVRPEAYGDWRAAYFKANDAPLAYVAVDGPHVGLMERPVEWCEALRKAYATLSILTQP